MGMTLKELQDLIDKANVAYYTDGTAIMEDARYDKLREQLKSINPTDPRLSSVGSVIRDSILTKRKHKIPMGSLNKVVDESEWNSWITNNIFKKNIPFTEMFHASLKMDGCSVGLEYKNGKLWRAISRGDGIEGEDITANAHKFKNLPTVVTFGNSPFNGFIRGEVVLKNEEWLSIDKDKTSNPRNLAGGIIRRKDGAQSEFVSFFAFRAFTDDELPIGKTEEQMSERMIDMGFIVAPYYVGKKDNVWSWYEKMQEKRSTMDFWIDGVVVKLNNIQQQLDLGESSGCPKGQCAIKFDSEGAETKLLSVEINVGSTGAIVPVAKFEPVRLGGTTITCATLCNWDNIESLGVYIGDTIRVIKAGDIIPRVMEVVTTGTDRKKILLPVKCPCCGGKVGYKSNISGEDSTAIYCLNENCPSVVTGKIDKYLSSLDIQGIGDSVIQAIVSELNVKTPADLYLLHTKIDKLANLMLGDKVRFGEKRAEKLISEIEQRRKLTVSELLGSLGIFGLGKRRVVLIQEAVGGKLDKLENWFDSTLKDNAELAGVPNLAERINQELISQKDYIMSFLKNGVEIVYNTPKKIVKSSNFVFCITGKLNHPKSFYQTKIENAGHGYVDSLSSEVTHLVAADPNGDSSKLKKAAKNGIKVISETELLKYV